jgi:hypothetical protein
MSRRNEARKFCHAHMALDRGFFRAKIYPTKHITWRIVERIDQ